MRRRARVRGDRHQVTLPKEIREALQVRSGDEIEFAVDQHGTVTVRGYTSIPTDQAWFFTPPWQDGEREADEQIAGSEGRRVYEQRRLPGIVQRELMLPSGRAG